MGPPFLQRLNRKRYVVDSNDDLSHFTQQVEFFSRKVQQKIKERSGADDEEEEEGMFTCTSITFSWIAFVEEEDLEADTDETLSLAFEIFETARIVFTQTNRKLEVAKVHIKLGTAMQLDSLSMSHYHVLNKLTSYSGKVNEEGDNLAEAISEYEQALEIRQSLLGPDHPLTVKVKWNASFQCE